MIGGWLMGRYGETPMTRHDGWCNTHLLHALRKYRPQMNFASPEPTLTVPRRERKEDAGKTGFTLVELMVVVAIMATLASIGIPRYAKMVLKAQNTVAVSDIKSLERDIAVFLDAKGRLPDCLDELPGGNRLDPWGNPYQYLCYAGSEEHGGGGGGHTEEVACSSNSGNGGQEKMRKDRFLHPLNTDYDLYSTGPDGRSVAPITSKLSQDDIIRANDGAYIDVASKF